MTSKKFDEIRSSLHPPKLDGTFVPGYISTRFRGRGVHCQSVLCNGGRDGYAIANGIKPGVEACYLDETGLMQRREAAGHE